MEVDFNNLRKKAVIQANELSRQLSDAILKSNQWANPNDMGPGIEVDIKGYVLIDADDIRHSINSLLASVNLIACAYEEGNENLKCLHDELPNIDFFCCFV